MTDFFTSDHHFYHRNIIDYCVRPFKVVKDMNEFMIERWNSRVTARDTVYHLGDFGLSGISNLHLILERLNGNKVLIRGNHDSCTRTAYRDRIGFLEVYDQLEVHGFKLCHYPMVGDTEREDRFVGKRPKIEGKDWLLCGHVHDLWRISGRQLNVGVDVNDYYPLSLEQIKQEIEAKEKEYAMAEGPGPTTA